MHVRIELRDFLDNLKSATKHASLCSFRPRKNAIGSIRQCRVILFVFLYLPRASEKALHLTRVAMPRHIVCMLNILC